MAARSLGLAALLASVSCGGARPGSRSPALGGAAIVQLARGREHGCLLRADRTVWCWGRNEEGQLGKGGRSFKPLPVRVVGLTTVRRIAAGDDSSCAVLEDGNVSCWGDDIHGQLGDRTTPPWERREPALVPDLSSVRDVAIGSAHTCFLLNDGEVQCRGGWERSRVSAHEGDGRPCSITVPDCTWPAPAVAGATAIAGSRDHFCALLADGAARCWSFIRHDTPRIAFEQTPVVSPEVQGATEIAVGRSHACALLRDGAVECWGSNDHGQLGTGDRTPRSRPVRVRDLPPSRAVAAGDCQSCALADDGTVRCWGEQRCVEAATDKDLVTAPRRFRGVDDVIQVLPGWGETLLLTKDGSVASGDGLQGDAVIRFNAAELDREAPR